MPAPFSRSWPASFGLLLSALLGGCADAPEQQKIAEAFTIESKDAKIADEIAAKKAEERKQAAQARREHEAAIEAAIEEATVQPAEPPADLDTACDAVVEAYDAYMKSGRERDALEWSDGRRRKMGERRVACIKIAKLPVAACEAQALRSAPPALDELPRQEAARRLMERCHDEFGGA